MPATVSHTTRTFPFGEEMAAQHAGGEYSTRYKFNGKELDPETGYYYYGARYYDPVVSRWLSVDPLAEKYPGFSAYNFTLNNPVRMFDPNGKGPQDIILLGTNGSSVTIKTDIIDIKVNAGEILGDIGGNYTLVGDDVLVAALDIAGIFDPTGIADAASGTIEMKNGNFWSGLASYAGIFPYLGDLAKLGKLPKHLKTLERAIKLVREEKLLKYIQRASRIENVHGFASMEKLLDHFKDHAKEFGGKIKSPQQYLKAAQNFFKREGDNILQYTRANGEIVRYDVINNTFGVVKPDGTIKTFFKPKDGMEYFKKNLHKDFIDNQ